MAVCLCLMKKFLSIFCVLVMILSSAAFAEDAISSAASSYVETDEDGVITVTTVYDLSQLAGEELPKYEAEPSEPSVPSQPSEPSVPVEPEMTEEVINRKVSYRAKNAIVIQIGNYAAVASDVLEWIDKDNKSVVPYIKENRTMVPLRYIAEKLGATVGFDDVKREVSITLNDKVFKVVIGDSKYTLNDKE